MSLSTLLKKWRHHRFQGWLSEHLDGALEDRRRLELERHLSTCAACREELEELQRTVSALRRLPPLAVPRAFRLPVPAPQPSPRWFGALALASSASGALLLLLLSADVLGTFEPEAAAQPRFESKAGAVPQAEVTREEPAAPRRLGTPVAPPAAPEAAQDVPPLTAPPKPPPAPQEPVLPLVTVVRVMEGTLFLVALILLGATLWRWRVERGLPGPRL